jgi:hypothetical protein
VLLEGAKVLDRDKRPGVEDQVSALCAAGPQAEAGTRAAALTVHAVGSISGCFTADSIRQNKSHFPPIRFPSP